MRDYARLCAALRTKNVNFWMAACRAAADYGMLNYGDC